MIGKLYKKIIPLELVRSINDFYDQKQIAARDKWSLNKNLEYHDPEDFSYQVLNPILTDILGDHEFSTGSYKECIQPYPMHVDTYEAHDELSTVTSFSSLKKHNRALLIPLVEGSCFKTVTFKCFSKTNAFGPMLDSWKGNYNGLDEKEFTHVKKQFHDHIKYLPIDVEYTWTLGDILTWDRDQLHISADFTRCNLTKKFLVLFIA